MSTPVSARELFRSGQLGAAIEAQNAAVRARPADPAARGFLVDLLCFAGSWERADQQLETLRQQDRGAEVGIALVRQLIRAGKWRQEFFREGRLPEFVQPPSERLQLHLRAAVLAREGASAEAAGLLARAEETRPRPRGTADGAAFADFRDLDDLTAGVLEVLTSTGKYYWIPLERVRTLELHPPVHARDLLWRRATLVVADGPEGEVFLPAIYCREKEEEGSEADLLRLGRRTDWSEDEGQPVRGRGQRMYLVGEEARAVAELGRIEFEEGR